MPSRCYVFNEWLVHDISGDNGTAAQNRARQLLVRLRDGEDMVAIGRDTPWMEKAFSLMRLHSPEVRLLSKLLHLSIIRDSKKCLLLDESEIKRLPDEQARIVPPEDAYLVQAYHAASADLIVTTDTDFHEIANRLGIRAVLRDDFLAEYL